MTRMEHERKQSVDRFFNTLTDLPLDKQLVLVQGLFAADVSMLLHPAAMRWVADHAESINRLLKQKGR